MKERKKVDYTSLPPLKFFLDIVFQEGSADSIHEFVTSPHLPRNYAKTREIATDYLILAFPDSKSVDQLSVSRLIFSPLQSLILHKKADFSLLLDHNSREYKVLELSAKIRDLSSDQMNELLCAYSDIHILGDVPLMLLFLKKLWNGFQGGYIKSDDLNPEQKDQISEGFWIITQNATVWKPFSTLLYPNV